MSALIRRIRQAIWERQADAYWRYFTNPPRETWHP